MSKTKNSAPTNGPWRVGDAGATVFGGPNPEKTLKIVAVVSREPIPSPEAVANAHLIAAAPEMLSAIKYWAAAIERGERSKAGDFGHRTLLELIAKAEGVK